VRKATPHVVLDARCSSATAIDHVFVKLLPEHLFCVESVCAWLAHDARLPVPESYTIKVPRQKLPRDCPWQFGNSTSIDAFGSKAVENSLSLDRIDSSVVREKVLTWPMLELAAAFDELVANDDRSENNMLLDARGDIWLIDHARCLGGAGQRLFSTEVTPSFRNYFLNQIAQMTFNQRLQRREPLIRACTEFVSRVSRVPYASLGVSDALRAQVEPYLQQRAARLGGTVLHALGLPDLYEAHNESRPVQ
jgi:hypothetical protein